MSATLNAEAQRYLALILDGKRQEAADYVFGLLDAGESIRGIYLDVFQPALYEVGRLWENNTISVAREHYCTAVTQSIISRMYPRMFTAETNGLVMVGCCVQDELHEIGIRMVCDFFEMDGWDSHYLGANNPSQAVVDFVRDQGAHVLGVSVTMDFHLSGAERLLDEVRRCLGERIKILVGGYPFAHDPDLAQKMGADAWAARGDEAVTLAGKLVGQSPDRSLS